MVFAGFSVGMLQLIMLYIYIYRNKFLAVKLKQSERDFALSSKLGVTSAE